MQPREQVPHFTVRTVEGATVRYADLWQRQNLLLVQLPPEPSPDSDAVVARLQARRTELTAHDTAVVITRQPVPGAPCPGVVIADRWGEIFHAAGASSSGQLPRSSDLVEWLRYVQMQCPECQGETR